METTMVMNFKITLLDYLDYIDMRFYHTGKF